MTFGCLARASRQSFADSWGEGSPRLAQPAPNWTFWTEKFSFLLKIGLPTGQLVAFFHARVGARGGSFCRRGRDRPYS